MENMESSKGEIVMYQPDETIRLEVRVENETVWLNRQQIAALFSRDVKTIGKHISNALHEELEGESVVAKFATTASDGKNYQVEYYNLDMIMSVGYRVKSKCGIQFRQWARNSLRISKCGKRQQQTSSTGYDEPMHIRIVNRSILSNIYLTRGQSPCEVLRSSPASRLAFAIFVFLKKPFSICASISLAVLV